MSNKESFLHQIKRLKSFRRVIAIDITGFGQSKKMAYAYSLDDYVFDVLSVINELKLVKYDILAHSFGGRIAVKLALLDKRVNKLILTGSAGLKPKRKLSFYFKVYLYKLLKRVFKVKNLNNFGSLEYKMLNGVEKQSYVKIVNEFLDAQISKIKNKALLIFGENDSETPLYLARRFNKKIINSQFYKVKGAGHFCFVEKPYEFNVVMLEFLNGE
ncbi:MAG: alpha/beta hydrolase [Clostridia bacterium]|nr:alpha/beta hydrolase [Clostridia bacterium]